MGRIRHLSVLIFMAATTVLTWAQNHDCTPLAQQALEISGVNQDIDAMAQMLVSDDYIRQITADKPDGPEFISVLKPILGKSFDGPSLKKELLRLVADRCNPAQMAQAVKEMGSPLVTRMLQLEAAQRTPEGQEKAKKYMRIVQIAPPPDSQMAGADAFDQKTGLTDFTVDSILAVSRGFLQGAGAPNDAIEQLQRRREQMKAQMQGTMLATILLTYKDASKPDLTKYGEELSSGPLKWYYDTVHRSLLEILEQHAQAAGHDIKAASVAKRE